MCALALMTLLLSMGLFSFVLYDRLSEDIHRELSSSAAYLRAGIEAKGMEYLETIKGEDEDSRITLIGGDGQVLFDSQVELALLDNHKERPEVQAALARGVGEAVRMSDTLDRQTYYYAEKLSDGTVLRISSTTDNTLATLLKTMPFLLGILLLVLACALFLARQQVRHFLAPINGLDLEHPLENESYDELSPLLLRIHQQRLRIEEQMNEAREKQEEFKTITDNMKEGLVLLDGEGKILSVNESALTLLHGESQNTEGRHISNLARDARIQGAVERALSGEPAEEILSAGEKVYQLWVNPVLAQNQTKGAVMLLLDVTRDRESEKMRREFSANVSHELKTPLTVISGYAELLRNGLAQPQDVVTFGNTIFEEAARLLALINDIIRISELDENNVLPAKERMDLLQAADAVATRLQESAENREVRLLKEGEPAFIMGVPGLIYELLYNLCENAIKYNRRGGAVTISVGAEGDMAFVRVRDTGIGIPAEDLGRIFERFYRVDKSHSKETGGTGLGLSIAKHVASYHGGRISVESQMGEGTTMTAYFPMAGA